LERRWILPHRLCPCRHTIRPDLRQRHDLRQRARLQPHRLRALPQTHQHHLHHFTPGVGGLTDILLVATHGFQIAAGTFFANHNLTGTWSTATGNIAQLNTTVDINSANPSMIQQIILINTAATTSFVSSSPAVGGGTTSPVMTIQMALRLRIDGVGTTILPGSADVDVTLVPAPAAAALLPLVGLLAARRRR